jgi:eukaryotic-like serine/threonine-protein kinase
VNDSSAKGTAAQTAVNQLGRYRLLRSLGIGGMAEAFKASYSGPGGFERTVVVKRILPANCEDPEFVRMFMAEAKILGMLHHPNVVQVYDFGESDGSLFLVLEYVDGPSLGRLLKALRNAKRPVPLAIAAHFGHEVCRALDYVHGLRTSDGEPMNVIHRDVTPSNVVLTSTGSVKLLDFGIAKYAASEAATEHQTIKGKPAYLAPEIIEGYPFDGRSDLFSLGVILYETLTLAPLFAGDTDLSTLHRVLEMPISPPSWARTDVPTELDKIVMKALERDPARRFPSAAEMGRALEEFVVASKLRNDDVVAFMRDAEPLMPPPRANLQGLSAAPSVGTMPTAPEAEDTKLDLGLRIRMSPLGRLFGSREK